MDKNLPRVCAIPINKPITNNREYHISSVTSNELRNKQTENIPRKINEIFSSPNHVYKSKVRIIIDNNEVEAVIVGKTNNYLLTLNGEKISINEIEQIEKI